MTFDASTRTGGRRKYQFSEHGNSEQHARRGDFVIKNNAAETWKLAYDVNSTTTIRIFPHITLDGQGRKIFGRWEPYTSDQQAATVPEGLRSLIRRKTDGQQQFILLPLDPAGGAPAGVDLGPCWEPYRYSRAINAFSDFIRRYPAVKSTGNPSATFIIGDPSDDPQQAQLSPPWVLYNAIEQAIRLGQERPGWAAMTKGSPGRGAVLPRPTELYLVQGAVIYCKGRQYPLPKGMEPEGRPLVIELGQSAGISLLHELNLLKPEYQNTQGDSNDDWETVMQNGDVVSLERGRWVTFYRLPDGDPRARQQQTQQGPAGWNAIQPTAFGHLGGLPGGQQQQQQNGYGCYLEPTFGNYPASIPRGPWEQIVARKVTPWDELLHVPSHEEQAAMLCERFPADMIAYAFQGRPEWITESMRRRMSNTQTFVSPGVPAPNAPGFPGQGPMYGHGGGLTPPPVGLQYPPTGQPTGPAPGPTSWPGVAGAGMAPPTEQSPMNYPAAAPGWPGAQPQPVAIQPSNFAPAPLGLPNPGMAPQPMGNNPPPGWPGAAPLPAPQSFGAGVMTPQPVIGGSMMQPAPGGCGAPPGPGALPIGGPVPDPALPAGGLPAGVPGQFPGPHTGPMQPFPQHAMPTQQGQLPMTAPGQPPGGMPQGNGNLGGQAPGGNLQPSPQQSAAALGLQRARELAARV